MSEAPTREREAIMAKHAEWFAAYAEAMARRAADDRLMRHGVGGLRQRYITGTIDVAEFESQLETLLRLDPMALDRKRSRPTNDPSVRSTRLRLISDKLA